MRKITTIVDILRDHASQRGSETALIYLGDGESESTRYSYHDLFENVTILAARLASEHSPGSRAILAYSATDEFVVAFLACLASGLIAVPVMLPQRSRGHERFLRIIDDCDSRLVLTSTRDLESIPTIVVRERPDENIRVKTTDRFDHTQVPTYFRIPHDFYEIAFLQYTSGSTATPKGVRVTHQNILANQSMIRDAFNHGPDTIFVSWLPYYHDMGLIGGILHPLFLGIKTILMPPWAFIQKPYRWLRAISKYRGTTSGGPNFAYELCLGKALTHAKNAELDLSSWRVAFNGAEPINATTLERFTKAFSSYGFDNRAHYPCYGMAEATLFISGGRAHDGAHVKYFSLPQLADKHSLSTCDTHALVSCGHNWGKSEILIVDPKTREPLPAGSIGEIWVRGPQIAQGYWNQSGEPAKAFGNSLSAAESGDFLATGDLGLQCDGHLYVTGRAKELIIIRGRNIYPHDLEASLRNAHPSTQDVDAAAFSVLRERGEQLVIVQEIARAHVRTFRPQEVAEAIRERIAIDHQLDVADVQFVGPRNLPRTSSGKIRRLACREAYLQGTLQQVRNEDSGSVPRGDGDNGTH